MGGWVDGQGQTHVSALASNIFGATTGWGDYGLGQLSFVVGLPFCSHNGHPEKDHRPGFTYAGIIVPTIDHV